MTASLAYLDTCIVSGLAKADLSSTELTCLQRILEAHKAGTIRLITSEQTKREISRIPAQHRTAHSAIYSLLQDVPLASAHRTDPGLLLLGVGGGRREDPLFTRLKAILPDEADALHVFQAAKHNVDVLITVDQRTMLSRTAEVEHASGVRLRLPSDFVAEELAAPQR